MPLALRLDPHGTSAVPRSVHRSASNRGLLRVSPRRLSLGSFALARANAQALTRRQISADSGAGAHESEVVRPHEPPHGHLCREYVCELRDGTTRTDSAVNADSEPAYEETNRYTMEEPTLFRKNTTQRPVRDAEASDWAGWCLSRKESKVQKGTWRGTRQEQR